MLTAKPQKREKTSRKVEDFPLISAAGPPANLLFKLISKLTLLSTVKSLLTVP